MPELKIVPQVGLRQSMVVRPDLIQSLKLLMEPILNLEQILRQRLSDNPLLEEVEQHDSAEELAMTQDEPDRKEDGDIDKIDWQEFLGEDHEYNFGNNYRDFSRGSDDELPESVSIAEKTLFDHLLEQLGFARLSEAQNEIGAYIIGNIDESGFLRISVEDIAEELKVEQEEVQGVLSIIKTFDPSGVGSADLRECLLAQLDEQGLKGSLAWIIIDEHLQGLEKRSQMQLAKALGSSPERVQMAMEVIRGLSPSPATGMFVKAAAHIVPDLIIEKVGDDFVVFHNDKNLPSLRINQSYRNLIKRGNKTSETTKKYVRDKLEQARWLINAINQRRSTMITVAEAIVDQQREFFEHGESHLKPMTMEQVADIVGMNVATISRVANGKYIQTPLGMFEIKYFFNTGVTTSNGDDLPKRVVKTKIEDIINDENPATPYSDQEIAKLLDTQGIKLARRTVTKYREELSIKAARYRKQVSRTL
ncbi:MAG: RNA polymerase factor sigma-54 [candidate division Zixibacteria bacterium]|nr:RNA polymerase factor sigma-54 [candidate division Zixibacteria bacterium]